MDDILSHWESYLHNFGVLANAPYSQFCPHKGWDVVYTWESLKKQEPTFTSSFVKKANKPSLVVVVAPTTTEIGDDFFPQQVPQDCLHQAEVSIFRSQGVWKKESFAPTVECYLKPLPLAAPISEGTLGS